jgi:hypothetical protein
LVINTIFPVYQFYNKVSSGMTDLLSRFIDFGMMMLTTRAREGPAGMNHGFCDVACGGKM